MTSTIVFFNLLAARFFIQEEKFFRQFVMPRKNNNFRDTTDFFSYFINLLKSLHTILEALRIGVQFFYIYICYLASSRQTLGYCRGSSRTNLMLITAFDTYSTGRPSAVSQRVFVSKQGRAPSGVWNGPL